MNIPTDVSIISDSNAAGKLIVRTCMWEESKEEVFTQQNGGALLLHKEKKNGRRRWYE